MTGAVIAITIVLIAIGGITVGVVAYFGLQRHRTDAAALAEYRALAEEYVRAQQELEAEVGELGARLTSVEKLLKTIE